MHKFSYNYEQHHKDELNRFLSEKRKDGNFKVLDVGGSVGPWFWDNTLINTHSKYLHHA